MNTVTIGRTLKKLRKESKLTQEQLAGYLQIDQSMLAKLEKGTRSFNSSLIEKICDLYCCSEQYLCGNDTEYIPLNFSFSTKEILTEDLDALASMNKISRNIRFMNRIDGN